MWQILGAVSFYVILQAYLTRRKKDKVFAVYDLNIVLHWAGHWAEDEKNASLPSSGTMRHLLELRNVTAPFTLSSQRRTTSHQQEAP